MLQAGRCFTKMNSQRHFRRQTFWFGLMPRFRNENGIGRHTFQEILADFWQNENGNGIGRLMNWGLQGAISDQTLSSSHFGKCDYGSRGHEAHDQTGWETAMCFFRSPSPGQAEWKKKSTQFSPHLTCPFQSMRMTYLKCATFGGADHHASVVRVHK